MKKITLIILLFFLFLAREGFSGEVVKLATTTSTYETGLLDYILPPFEKKHNVKVHTISVGTGKAIKLAENGDVDVILVHAKEAEERFVRDGFGVARHNVMYNDFVILGPRDDPASAMGLKGAKDVFKRIRDTSCTFISRGDDSGTDKKEKHLWKEAQINPLGPWYLETGQGMSATLRIADEKKAYVMLDRATYLANSNRIRLKIISEGDKDLFNPYGVIAVNPEKHKHVQYEYAMALIEWMISPKCQKMINEYKISGNQLFFAKSDN